MVGHGGSSAGSYLADPTSPIPSHCASIVVTSTVRVNQAHITSLVIVSKNSPWSDFFSYIGMFWHIKHVINWVGGKSVAMFLFSSALELERYWCAFCVKSPSWNASSLFCCCTFCRRTCWFAQRNLPALTFSFCIFALIDPAHDIFHTASFSAMCCYLNFFADFCWSVSSSKLNWLIFFESAPEVVFTAYAHAPRVMKNISYSGYTRAHFVQADICICRKKIYYRCFFTRWAIHFWSGSTLMQECFKNIEWRDADKKIRRWSFTFLET